MKIIEYFNPVEIIPLKNLEFENYSFIQGDINDLIRWGHFIRGAESHRGRMRLAS